MKKIIYVIVNIIFIISFITFISIIFILLRWNNDNENNKKQIEEINDIVKIKEDKINNNSNIKNINPPTNDVTSDYWYYIGMNFLNVNLTDLKEKNNDTVAWIKVNGTNINYPIVKYSDNDYYLKHSFKKEYTDAGWIFMDFRNDSNFNDKNTIIYGHSRLNKTMFGTLKNTITENWFNNIDNRIVKVSTNDYNYLYEVFSTYKIENENYYLKTKFSSDDDYKAFLNLLSSRSIFNYNVPLDENDKIITLSTCSSNNKKIVLHAKLIKTQKKDH